MNDIELKRDNEPTEPGDYIYLPEIDGLASKDTRPVLFCITSGPKGLGIQYPGMTQPWPLSNTKHPCFWSDKLNLNPVV